MIIAKCKDSRLRIFDKSVQLPLNHQTMREKVKSSISFQERRLLEQEVNFKRKRDQLVKLQQELPKEEEKLLAKRAVLRFNKTFDAALDRVSAGCP